MPFAQDRYAALALLAASASIDVDAALDALFLVPAGEATCRDDFAVVAGPGPDDLQPVTGPAGGTWAWGRGDAELPPWAQVEPAESCFAPPPAPARALAEHLQVKLDRLFAGEAVVLGDADLDALAGHFADDDGSRARRYFHDLRTDLNPGRVGLRDLYLARL